MQVAQECIVGRLSARGAILRDYRLALGKSPLQQSVIRGLAGGQNVVESTAAAALGR
jgi:hypothetical protein